MKEFTKKHLEEILGLKRGTVDFYYREGLVQPEIDNPTGRGTRRRYSKKNLIEFAVIRELVSGGIPVKQVKGVLGQQRKLGTINWLDPEAEWLKQSSKVILAIHNQGERSEIMWTTNEITVGDITRGSRSVVLIDISAITAGLRQYLG
jgi:DNA-binding transcriptional MerR regulator